jgi:LCP family protein required for cell wall assembly
MMRWLRRGLLLLIVLLVVALGGVLLFQQRVAAKVKMPDVRENRPPSNVLLAPMNILLLGVDLRQDFPDEGVRSDTLILLHLDPSGGWASMLSIPRDTFTNIPDFGENKINTAFARGYENAEAYGADTPPTAAGAALAADTVENFLGLRAQGQRINYVATINFNGFAKMIDAIGGIDINVPFEIIDEEYPTEDFGIMTVHIPAGQQHMDGTTALQYVRTRHADSDFGRAERQQQVIQAIVQALRNQPLLLRPISAMRLIDAAGDAIQTTMPVGRLDALLMGLAVARVDPTRIAQYRIEPGAVPVQEIGSDLVWDSAGVQAVVAEALTPPGEAQEQATIQVQNGAGVSGVAGQVTQQLASLSFTMASADNAEQLDESVIIDYGAHPATRARLSEALGDMPTVERDAAEAPAGVDIVVVLGADYQRYIRDQ